MISSGHGGRRYLPYAFTEQGVAMLSMVLRSETTIQTSIHIINAFVAMRRLLAARPTGRIKPTGGYPAAPASFFFQWFTMWTTGDGRVRNKLLLGEGKP